MRLLITSLIPLPPPATTFTSGTNDAFVNTIANSNLVISPDYVTPTNLANQLDHLIWYINHRFDNLSPRANATTNQDYILSSLDRAYDSIYGRIDDVYDDITDGGTLEDTTLLSPALTDATFSGTVTLSTLNSAGLVHTDAAGLLSTSLLVNGDITDSTITNTKLANSTVSYGGVTLALGGSDATPAFNLIDATGLPLTTGVTGILPVGSGGTGASSLTSGYLLKGNGTSAVSSSVIYDNGTNVGIGTTSPTYKLDVYGNAHVRHATWPQFTVDNLGGTGHAGVQIYLHSPGVSGGEEATVDFNAIDSGGVGQQLGSLSFIWARANAGSSASMWRLHGNTLSGAGGASVPSSNSDLRGGSGIGIEAFGTSDTTWPGDRVFQVTNGSLKLYGNGVPGVASFFNNSNRLFIQSDTGGTFFNDSTGLFTNIFLADGGQATFRGNIVASSFTATGGSGGENTIWVATNRLVFQPGSGGYLFQNSAGSATQLQITDSAALFGSSAPVSVNSTTDTTSLSSGALQVLGGTAITKSLLVGGNVGIGTTNPSLFKLQVDGNVGPNASDTYNLGAAGSNWGCLYYNGGTLGTCASDERLKENVSTLSFRTEEGDSKNSVIEKFARLTPHAFSYKSDETQAIYHGLIAQEVQEIGLEALVEEGEDGLLTVRYGDLQWVMVEAIQEMWASLQELFANDDAQNDRILELEKQVNELRETVRSLGGVVSESGGSTGETPLVKDEDLVETVPESTSSEESAPAEAEGTADSNISGTISEQPPATEDAGVVDGSVDSAVVE